MVVERFGVGQCGLVAEELQLPLTVRRRDLLQEQPAEQPREDPNRQEKSRSARNPAFAAACSVAQTATTLRLSSAAVATIL